MADVLTPIDALQLLRAMGATPRLVRHHELVLEAAVLLCERMGREVGVAFDRNQVLVGAALHDAGKIVHPEEMSRPGSRHELTGEQLLSSHGVPPELARFCVTHAAWSQPGVTIEDLLVALADKLWKGTRDDGLERRVTEVIARTTKREVWAVFEALDSICEAIAAEGPDRLASSAV